MTVGNEPTQNVNIEVIALRAMVLTSYNFNNSYITPIDGYGDRF